MHKTDLFIVSRYPEGDMVELAKHYTLHVLSEIEDKKALFSTVGPRIRALGTNGESGATAELMDALPNLEIIVSYGVGVDAIDLEHAAKRGIRVTNTPDVLTNDVADMGVGMLLAVAREISANDALVRAGLWGRQYIPLATRVFGKRIGIVGLGRIGRAFARRVAGFDMAIAYCDRMQFDDVDYTYYDSIPALAANVDFLVVCAAADRANKGLIGHEVFDALGQNGYIVNIARGSIMDEPVLLSYLEQKKIRGAALDVFWGEPDIDKRFLSLDNVVLQPHRSSATVETRAAMADLVRQNLAAFFAGEALVTEFPTR